MHESFDNDRPKKLSYKKCSSMTIVMIIIFSLKNNNHVYDILRRLLGGIPK